MKKFIRFLLFLALLGLILPISRTEASDVPFEIPVLLLKYFPTQPCYQLNSANKLTVNPQLVTSNVVNSSPALAFDGSRTGGRWHLDPNTMVDSNYLQADLGGGYGLGGVNLFFYSRSDMPERFQISSSMTGEFSGEEKTLVGFEQSLDCPGYQLEGGFLKTCVFPSTLGRFFRLVIEKSTQKQYNLLEAEVYTVSPKLLIEKKCYDLKEGGITAFLSHPEMEEPLAPAREKAISIVQTLKDAVIQGSKYHGYKVKEATPSLNFTIYIEKEYLEAIPRRMTGFFRQFADQFAYLGRENICDLVDNQGVKEVWTIMYHRSDGSIVPKESNQAMGRTILQYWNYPDHGEASNDTYKENDLPICNHSYTVFEFNINTGQNDAVHSYLHQIENIFGFVDYSLFWQKFVGKKFHTDPGEWICGNSHFPPQVPHSDYFYNSPDVVYTSCEDWKPDGTGTTGSISCTNWSCNPAEATLKYYIWWMQNLPGMGQNLVSGDKSLINWWGYIGDFDKTIVEIGKSFYRPTPQVCSLKLSSETGSLKYTFNNEWKHYVSFTSTTSGKADKVSVKVGNWGNAWRGVICKMTNSDGTQDISTERSSSLFTSSSGIDWREIDFKSNPFILHKDTQYRLYCKGPDFWGSLYWIYAQRGVPESKTYKISICQSP